MVRYKTPALQEFYCACRRAAANPDSEFWYAGKPHRGAGHRAAYGNGRSGVLHIRGDGKTFAEVAYRAGQDDAKAPGARQFVTLFEGRHGEPVTRAVKT